jgi:hypothetical protein
MRWIVVLALLLAGCDSPAPAMMGGWEVRLTRGGHDYAVHVKGRWVEVIRFGWAGRAERAAIRQQMVALIPEATGCIARRASLHGDSGEMRGTLRCPPGREPLPPRLR